MVSMTTEHSVKEWGTKLAAHVIGDGLCSTGCFKDGVFLPVWR